MRENIEKTDKQNVCVMEFDAWGELIDFADKAIPKTSLGRSSRTEKSEGWSGTKTFEAAVKLAREGWREGEAKLAELSEPLIDDISQLIERQQYVHDVDGDGIDVARYVDGEPECFTRFEPEIVTGIGGRKLIKLVYNITASSGVSTKVMNAKGAAIAALVETLELAGNRVEVTLRATINNHGKAYVDVLAIVKRFDQPIDRAQLIYALAHPSCFRRIMFSVLECAPSYYVEKLSLHDNGGYGHPVDLENRRGDIYIGSSSSGDVQWENKESAEKWVIDQLKAQGVVLKERKAPEVVANS